jgi:BirA family biotin operon repressor/biotin-[acetyl-CoA-carboxylase] ligase
VALSPSLCDDRPAVGDRLDLDRLQQLLRTDFIGRRVSYEASTASTMDLARREAQAGAPEGALAIAEEQTAGRGRLGRTWVSPPGVNLYFTLILRPSLEELRYLSVIAPLAVCQAIEETTGLLPRIKWPNDVLINERKVAGILIQSEISGERVEYALLGPGINVNLDVAAHEEIRDIATSLRAEQGREVPREEVLAATLNHLEALYLAVRRGEVVSMGWKHRLDTLGKHVRIEFAGGAASEQGVVVDADSDGALILRRDDGSHVRIEAGEVTLRQS